MIDSLAVSTIINALGDKFIALSDSIWDSPELRWEETQAVERQIAVAERHGMRITRELGGIPTAFSAELGQGGPLIAFLGEYDALAGLSQVAGSSSWQSNPEDSSGNGHGCGHHLLGAGSLLAAVTVATYLEERGLPGRVRYYGCPAEEAAAGKTYMVKAGVFDDIGATMLWHPWQVMTSRQFLSLAYVQVYFRYKGVAAHAGGSPHLGRSALDAVELLNVGVNFLREHMTDSSRIHYAITDAGGGSPNVVQANATAYYLVRAKTAQEMRELYARVVKIAEGAALMTETELTIEFDGACAEYLPNRVLEEALHRHVERIGGVPFDDNDQLKAMEFRRVLPEAGVESDHVKFSLDPIPEKPLFDGVVPLGSGPRFLETGSTDVGDVSWVTPTVQLLGGCFAIGTPFHSWQLVAQGKLPAAHKGMLHAAEVVSSLALELFDDASLLEQAKTEFRDATTRSPYASPIPDGVVAPPLRPRPVSKS